MFPKLQETRTLEKITLLGSFYVFYISFSSFFFFFLLLITSFCRFLSVLFSQLSRVPWYLKINNPLGFIKMNYEKSYFFNIWLFLFKKVQKHVTNTDAPMLDISVHSLALNIWSKLFQCFTRPSCWFQLKQGKFNSSQDFVTFIKKSGNIFQLCWLLIADYQQQFLSKNKIMANENFYYMFYRMKNSQPNWKICKGGYHFIYSARMSLLYAITIVFMWYPASTIPDKIFGRKWSNPVKLDRNRKVWYLFLRAF